MRTFPLCLECASARWPRHSYGYCVDLRVKEMNTTDARATGGSCGLNGVYWIAKVKEKTDVGSDAGANSGSDEAVIPPKPPVLDQDA